MENSEKIGTGISELDRRLDGGILSGRPYILVGGSGTGKSVFGMQFLQEGIKKGENVLYVTFEEPKEEIIKNMSGFGWDMSKVNFLEILPDRDGNWRIPSGAFFERPGMFSLSTLITALQDAVSSHKVKRLVVDSLTTFSSMYDDESKLRKDTLALLNNLSRLGITSFLIVEREELSGMENYLARGTIRLIHRADGRRMLKVEKLRGQKVPGVWLPFVITNKGIRLACYSTKKDVYAHKERVKTGIEGLDKMLNGGFIKGDTVMISGSPGSGKSVLGLQFTKEGCRKGEKCLYVTFEERPAELIRNARNFDIDLEHMQKNSLVDIIFTSPISFDVDEHFLEIKSLVKGKSRVVIDAINTYQSKLDDATYNEFMSSIISLFKDNDITSLHLVTVPQLVGSFLGEHSTSVAFDVIVLMRYVEIGSEMQKSISVLKMRGSAHDREIRSYEISNKGITVMLPFTGLTGVLSGTPRPTIEIESREFFENGK